MIRVVIVDDHEFFRSCLASLINASADFEVVGECHDGTEVVDAVAALGAEIVVMDIQMITVSGIEAAAMLHSTHPRVRVVMLTSDTADSSRAAARAHGAVGYLVKGSSHDLLLTALRRVALGGSAWPEDLRDLEGATPVRERQRASGDHRALDTPRG
jgi:DNA-binding NarL/FixJ family response regulator